jgi:hypothetical protein
VHAKGVERTYLNSVGLSEGLGNPNVCQQGVVSWPRLGSVCALLMTDNQ